MGDRHGLVHQNLVVDNVALSTLAAKTALALNTAWNSPEASFLMKRTRFLLKARGMVADDDGGPVIILLAHGNATVAEVASAMSEINAQGPTDITEALTQDNAWIVYQNPIQMLQKKTAATEAYTTTEWMNFGGKNGIPNMEEAGVTLHAYNAGNGNLDTGMTIQGLVQIQGVWLRG